MVIKRIQLGLIHVALAMTLVPINSTLNRVMIKELAISASLVAVLASLPYLLSPIQMVIGSFSDRHPVWGLRRTPYILLGLFLCVGGVVIAPYVAFMMTSQYWAGIALAALTFGAWGMGFNFASVSYLSLASEISGERGRGRTVSVMWFMMIAGIIVTAIALSHLLDPFSAAALLRAFQIVAGLALGLGLLGVIGLERRVLSAAPAAEERVSWGSYLRLVTQNRQVLRFFIYLLLLLAAILGQDVLLEPFAGEAFGLPVTATTRITSIWGGCVLLSLLVAGLLETRMSKRRVAFLGGASAVLAFGTIALSGILLDRQVFYAGVVPLGLATGLATVSNLSLMLDMTTARRVGMYIGAWGMADALARGFGAILSGVVRDSITRVAESPVSGYVVVFALEGLMLVASLVILRQVDVMRFRQEVGGEQDEALDLLERAALANDA